MLQRLQMSAVYNLSTITKGLGFAEHHGVTVMLNGLQIRAVAVPA